MPAARRTGDWYEMMMGATCSGVTCTTSPTEVFGIVTRGRGRLFDNWVTQYSVAYSRDGTLWHYVDNRDSFPANSDRTSYVTKRFMESVVASYIRITVRDYVGYPALRAGVVECSGPDVAAPRVQCSIRAIYDPEDAARSASSVKKNSPAGSRFHRGKLDSPLGWVANTGSTGEWYQIMMGAICSGMACTASPKEIVGIVTRGRANRDNWVTWYSLHRSDEGGVWTPVDDGKMFSANFDRSSYVIGLFIQSVSTSYIRITVREYFKYPSMRAGVVQCH